MWATHYTHLFPLEACRYAQGRSDGPVVDGYVLGEFQGLKAVVADLIDRGVFSEDECLEDMKERLCE